MDDDRAATTPATAEALDDTSAAESAERYVLRLYVTGSTPRSARAIRNTRRLCENNLEGRYELEVIDIYQHPEATREAQIIAAPTLVKLLPLPLRRIIGDLSNSEKVLASLDLPPRAGLQGSGAG